MAEIIDNINIGNAVVDTSVLKAEKQLQEVVGKLLKLRGAHQIMSKTKVQQVLAALPKTFIIEAFIRLAIIHYNYDDARSYAENLSDSKKYIDNLIGNSDGLFNELPIDGVDQYIDIIVGVLYTWVKNIKEIGDDIFNVFPELEKYDLIKLTNDVFKLTDAEVDSLITDKNVNILLHNYSAAIDKYLHENGIFPNSCFGIYDDVNNIQEPDYENGLDLNEIITVISGLLGSTGTATVGDDETSDSSNVTLDGVLGAVAEDGTKIPLNITLTYLICTLLNNKTIYAENWLEVMTFDEFKENALPTLTMISDGLLDYLMNGDGLGLFDESNYAVDLGLPSGTRWCSRNVGAATPTQAGKYFAWGDTTGVIGSLFDSSNVMLWDVLAAFTGINMFGMTEDMQAESGLNALGYENTPENIEAAKQYIKDYSVIGVVGKQQYFTENNYNSNVVVENVGGDTPVYAVIMGSEVNNELSGKYDAASVNTSAHWKMPSKEQLEELVNSTDITIDYDVEKNIPIVTFTGKNGNSINMYAGGYCENSIISQYEHVLCMWSSTNNPDVENEAYALTITYDYNTNELISEVKSMPMHKGMVIRPVYTAKNDVKDLTDKACSVYNFYNILDSFTQDGICNTQVYYEPAYDVITGKPMYNDDGSFKMRKRYEIIDSKIKCVLFSPVFQIYITDDGRAYFGGMCYIPSLISMFMRTLTNNLHLLIPEVSALPQLQFVIPEALKLIRMLLMSFFVRVGEGFFDGSIRDLIDGKKYDIPLFRPVLELLENGLFPEEDETPGETPEETPEETPSTGDEEAVLDKSLTLPTEVTYINYMDKFEYAIQSFNGVWVDSAETTWVHYCDPRSFNNEMWKYRHGQSNNYFVEIVANYEYEFDGNKYNDNFLALSCGMLYLKHNGGRPLYAYNNETGEYDPIKFVPHISWGKHGINYTNTVTGVKYGEEYKAFWSPSVDEHPSKWGDGSGECYWNTDDNELEPVRTKYELYNLLTSGKYTKWYKNIPNENFVPGEAFTPKIELVTQRGEIKTEGGGHVFDVISNIPWKVSTDVNWIDVIVTNYDENTGIGSRPVSVKVEDYTSYKNENPRIGHVTITGTGKYSHLTQTYELTQAGFKEILLVSSSEKTPDFDGQTYRIEVVSNVQWNIICVDEDGYEIDWIITDIKTGDKNGYINVAVNKNHAREGRTGYIVITGDKLEHIITFNQPMHLDRLKVSKSSVEVDELKQDIVINVRSNSSWTLSSDSESWLTTDVKGGEFDSSFIIHVEANTVSDRYGRIKVTSKYGDVIKIITVKQDFNEVYFEVRPLNYLLLNNQKYCNIQVISSVNWVAECDSDWFTINKTSANGSANIIVTCDENTNESMRNGFVRIYSEILDKEFVVEINQNGYTNVELNERQRMIKTIKENNGVWVIGDDNYVHYCNMHNVNTEHGGTDDYFVQLGDTYVADDTTKQYLPAIDHEYVLNGVTYNDNFLELSRAMLNAKNNYSYIYGVNGDNLTPIKFAPNFDYVSEGEMLLGYFGEIIGGVLGGLSYDSSYGSSYYSASSYTQPNDGFQPYTFDGLTTMLTSDIYTEWRTTDYVPSI